MTSTIDVKAYEKPKHYVNLDKRSTALIAIKRVMEMVSSRNSSNAAVNRYSHIWQEDSSELLETERLNTAPVEDYVARKSILKSSLTSGRE